MGYMEAIKRPFSDIVKLVIGAVVLLIPIVNFLGIGYFIQCIRMTLKGQSGLPEWKGWGSLFVMGILAVIIGFVWAIPTMVVAFIMIGGVLMSAAPLLMAGNTTGFVAAIIGSAGALMIGMTVTAVVAVIFSLLSTAAIIRYAEKGKFSAGFEFSAVMGKAFRSEYFAAWLIGGIYMFVVVALLSFVPLVGSAIAAFIGGVTFYTMVAEAFKGGAPVKNVPAKKPRKSKK